MTGLWKESWTRVLSSLKILASLKKHKHFSVNKTWLRLKSVSEHCWIFLAWKCKRVGIFTKTCHCSDIAQLVDRLATCWTAWDSKPGRSRLLSPPSKPVPEIHTASYSTDNRVPFPGSRSFKLITYPHLESMELYLHVPTNFRRVVFRSKAYFVLLLMPFFESST
jgi:hypothetical protein